MHWPLLLLLLCAFSLAACGRAAPSAPAHCTEKNSFRIDTTFDANGRILAILYQCAPRTR